MEAGGGLCGEGPLGSVVQETKSWPRSRMGLFRTIPIAVMRGELRVCRGGGSSSY